ncbi:hypothetical protein Nepgr_021995 [Nepenthes gracilis]|uniref:Uncharacterized protein n=1 Tax=Nepenthes gracilis TaxID=150966 RepID=A0AAD3SZS0_NEPGR|nr:hypothetical protein Nepgr_021995 [Nepenthes gracilis]
MVWARPFLNGARENPIPASSLWVSEQMQKQKPDTGPESNHPHPTSSSAWEILVNAASTVRAKKMAWQS